MTSNCHPAPPCPLPCSLADAFDQSEREIMGRGVDKELAVDAPLTLKQVAGVGSRWGGVLRQLCSNTNSSSAVRLEGNLPLHVYSIMLFDCPAAACPHCNAV
jgi:hypothetical protein